MTKFNAAGQLVYSTHLGGFPDDSWETVGRGIAVDAAGNAYVTGQTSATNFPTVNAFQPTNAPDPDVVGPLYRADAFVAKLNPSGSQLLYSTYLGAVRGGGINSARLGGLHEWNADCSIVRPSLPTQHHNAHGSHAGMFPACARYGD